MANKTKFRNMTGGYIGVCVEGDSGKMTAISLGPGEGVELSEREQRATANAPREPENNPFIGGYEDPDTGRKGPALVEVDAATEVQRPIGVKPEETAAEAGDGDGEPETGTRPSDEEVGTPEAPAKRTAARKAGAGKPKRPEVTA